MARDRTIDIMLKGHGYLPPVPHIITTHLTPFIYLYFILLLHHITYHIYYFLFYFFLTLCVYTQMGAYKSFFFVTYIYVSSLKVYFYLVYSHLNFDLIAFLVS